MSAIILPPIIVITFFIVAVAAISSTLFCPSGDVAHALGRVWSRFVLFISGVKLKVEGKERIPKGAVIFISNHASQFDIPVLTAILPKQFRFVVKQELFKIPLFSLAMKRTGYIPIDRRGGKAALRSLMTAAERLKAGKSLVIFPEGTRSPDGKLRRFKIGAFILAMRTGVPIVPVGISGSHKVLPKKSLKIKGGDITVRIGRPIQPHNFSNKDELCRAVWREVATLLDPDQRPAGSGEPDPGRAA